MQWAWAVAALGGVLLLMRLVGRSAARRGMAAGTRRVSVVEVTALDSRRRAIILRVDGREALLLTGGPSDVVVGWL